MVKVYAYVPQTIIHTVRVEAHTLEEGLKMIQAGFGCLIDTDKRTPKDFKAATLLSDNIEQGFKNDLPKD